MGGRGFRDKALRKFGVGGWVSRPVRYVTAKKIFTSLFREHLNFTNSCRINKNKNVLFSSVYLGIECYVLTFLVCESNVLIIT